MKNNIESMIIFPMPVSEIFVSHNNNRPDNGLTFSFLFLRSAEPQPEASQ